MSCVNVDDGYDARRTLKRVYDFFTVKNLGEHRIEIFW